MTSQEIFDTIINHLRNQGAKSTTADGLRSRYRDGKGNKCAIGCLIPEDKYDPKIEGWGVELVFHKTNMLEGITRPSEFMKDMQDLHDLNPVERWELQFELMAEKHKLIYAPKES